MNLGLLALLLTLAIVGTLFLGALAILTWRRHRPRPAEHGIMGEGWRRDHVAGNAGGDR